MWAGAALGPHTCLAVMRVTPRSPSRVGHRLRGTMETCRVPRPANVDGRDRSLMFFIVVALMLVMALAGLVTAYVAYPHRGQPIPHAVRLSERMTKRRDRNEP